MKGKTEQELLLEGLELDKLINDFKFNEHILNAVIRRESADKSLSRLTLVNSGYGMLVINAYEGYSFLIRAYMILNSDFLSAEQSQKLKGALTILETLRQQSLDLYSLNTASYSTYKASQKSKVLAQLETTGEVYMRGGFLSLGADYDASSHHVILRYTKAGYTYTRTEFNEGSGVEKLKQLGKSRYGWGVNRRRISPANLVRAIGVDVDTLFSNTTADAKITILFEPRDEDDNEQSFITTLQIISNCNTRSIRSLLRHVLGVKMLGELYEFVTTPLPEIQEQLAEKYEVIRVELQTIGMLGQFYSERQQVQTKPAMLQQTTVYNASTAADRFEPLLDAIIMQAEHILQKSFEKNNALNNFKKMLLESFTAPTIDKMAAHLSSWPYLNPESLPKVAFILAENLISHGVIHISNDKSQQNSLMVSATLTKLALDRFISEGIYKVDDASSVPGNELGIDVVISKAADSLIREQQDREFGGCTINHNYAEFVYTVKSMFISLLEPYVIYADVIKVIKKELGNTITASLQYYKLEVLLSKSKQILEATQTKLANNIILKPRLKSNLYKPVTKTAPNKIKIDKHERNLGSLFVKKKVEEINKKLNESPQVTPECLAGDMKFAIEHNIVVLSAKLLASKVDINIQDKFGQTLLMNAAQVGNVILLQELLVSGANPTLRNKAGETALMLAAEAGHSDVVMKLLEYPTLELLKDQLRATNKDNKNALMLATEAGHNEIAFKLLELDNNLRIYDTAYSLIQGQKTRISDDLANRCNEHRFVDAIKSMLVSLMGPYVDEDMLKAVQSELNDTIIATLNNYTLKELLSKSIEIIETTKTKLNDKLKPDKGSSSRALYIKLKTSIINKALTRELGVTQQFLTDAMRFAIEQNDGVLCYSLLVRKVEVNTQDRFGQTYLMNAAMADDAGLVENLLALGANLLLKNKAGKNAIMLAIEAGNSNIAVKMLAYNPALLEDLLFAKNQNGKTVLQLFYEQNETAIESVYEKVRKLLSDKNVQYSQRFITDFTKFSIEKNKQRSRNKHLCYVLVEIRKVDINTQDRFGQTFLMNAAQLGDVESFNRLLEKDANPLLKNEAGKNVFILAIEASNASIDGSSEILIKLMVHFTPALFQEQLREKDKDGNTVLHFAIEQGGIDIIFNWAVTENRLDVLKVILASAKDSPGLLSKMLKTRYAMKDCAFHYTFLHQAVIRGRNDVVEIILDSLADSKELLDDVINEKARNNQSAFQLAAETNPQIALIFLKYGATPLLSMIMNPNILADLKRELELRHMASCPPRTGKTIFEGLPYFIKMMFPLVIFPIGRDYEHER